MKNWRGLAMMAGLALWGQSALAGEHHTSLLDRWYGALIAVEREEIAALLAPSATIDLKDIGVTQTREEFISSLDEWAEAIEGGVVRHRIMSDGPDSVTVMVCYGFVSNAMLTSESFVFAGRQIISSVQETVATNCDGF